MTLTIDIDLPSDLARFRLPNAVNSRLQTLLDRQDAGQPLTRLIFAALDGLVLHQLVFGEPGTTDAAIEELRGLLRLLSADGHEAPENDG